MTSPHASPVDIIVDRLATLGPDAAHVALDMLLDKLSTTELAALAYDWTNTWARPEQVLPGGPWRSHGFLTGRRFGKSWANSVYVNQEAEAGRAMRIGFCAQNEDKTLEVMVHGDCGLIAMSPPWFKARWELGRVVWPNGAQAFPFTPEAPQNFRGPGLHLFWASEIQSWPAVGADEAFTNAALMASLGYARMIWDATPKKRHPILRSLLARSAEDPANHVIVRGTIDANERNLGVRSIYSLRSQMGQNSQRAREELDGEFSDDDDEALWKQAWIDAHRRDRPTKLARCIVSLDPALSDRAATDETGFIMLGLGADGQAYVLEDRTKRYAWEAWGVLAVDLYFKNECDCIVVERNAGFDALAANIRGAAKELGITVQVVENSAVTRHSKSAIYIKEVFSRKSKDERASPCPPAYQRGKVSHVKGAALGELEDCMTTWVPGPRSKSPNNLDALVQGLWELGVVSADDVGMTSRQLDGLAARVARLQQPGPPTATQAASSRTAAGAYDPFRDPGSRRGRGGFGGGGRGVL